MKPILTLLISLLAFASILFQLDRYFLKENDNFCLHTILGTVPYREEWTINTPLSDDLRKILAQPFHYLDMGHQSCVFASSDGCYVIKCYRFPSHLRLFPWINHPISYFFNKKRKAIMAYNEEKLDLSFSSYKIAFEQLQEATGTQWIHLNRGADCGIVHLIDRTGTHYKVPLNQLSVVVQKRFVMLFDALNNMQANHDREEMRKLIGSLISSISELWNQGIIDKDPVLDKNYGWDGNRVVYVDIGRFVRSEDIDNSLSLLLPHRTDHRDISRLAATK